MEAKQFALELKANIEQLSREGVEHISSENLIRYIDTAVHDLDGRTEFDIELYKANLQKWVEEHRNAHTHSVEMFKSVISAGQSALRTSFLMNGGASIALLTFIGHLATQAPVKVPLLANGLAIFVFGVLVSGITSGTTYLSQWFYAGGKPWKETTGFTLNILAIVFGLASYGIFSWGMYEAYSVFRGFT